MSDKSKDILSFFQKRSVVLTSETSDFVSGEEIAKELGFSRTAVWNHIKTLRRLGYEFEAIPRLGYRLVKSPDCLFPDEIEASLNTHILGKKIYYYDETYSTNTIADQLARDGAPEGTCVLAEFQTNGKGRMGRQWISPKRKNILLSVIFKPDLDPSRVSLMTLMGSIAVARALHTLGFDAQIKWPNDIYLEGKKVAGILTEMSCEQDKIKHLVVGIGLNVNSSESDFSETLRKDATSLYIIGQREMDRKTVLKELIQALEKAYHLVKTHDDAKLLEAWSQFSILTGCWVQASFGLKKIEGVVLGIDQNGALLLKLESGLVESILSGDIKIKYDRQNCHH